MATLTITNLTSAPLFIGDLYTTIAANAAISVTRPASALPAMTALQAAMAAGSVSVVVAYSSAETASGFASPPDVVTAIDLAEVASTAILSPVSVIRQSIAAGAGGAPDDVVIYASGTVPFKMRIIDAWSYISTAVGGSSWTVRTAVGGGGTALAVMSSASTGHSVVTTTTATAQAQTTDSLVVRRSDNGAAGEIFIMVRRET